MDDHSIGGRTVDCIAGDFTAGLIPCAPAGGYGLSDLQSTDVTRIVTRPTDYAGHRGAVVGHYITTAKLAFFGGLHSADTGYQEAWLLIVDRRNGIATLTEKGQSAVAFLCSAERQRF